jgi:di/tricarboxylate transporter
MVLLGLTSVIPDSWVPTLVDTKQLFSGFASNAVVSIIAVMIIGAGLDKTGVMTKVAAFILRVGGTTEKRIIPVISGTVGFISSFMQNVGAAALFLPVVSRVSARTGLPMSRLLMPMGFCAILGGTITMIGSSPLILLNDLILTSNVGLRTQGVPEMKTFELFAVTPIGLALVASGIAYFVLAGRFVLPANKSEHIEAGDTMAYFRDTYGLDGEIFEATVTPTSQFAGKRVEELERFLGPRIALIALRDEQDVRVAPARDVIVVPNATLALLGPRQAVADLAGRADFAIARELQAFTETLTATRAGISELVIPPSSSLVGKSLDEIRMRKTYGMNVLAVYRGKEVIRENLRELELQTGDTLLQHSSWEDLAAVQKDHQNFVVITTNYPHEESRPHKVHFALGFFLLALGLILFTDIRLSVALMAGAVGMIISGVIDMDEAYEAVSWKSVFLLASLIPLGLAVETTGTAEWIAVKTIEVLGSDVQVIVLQAVVAVLATFFTLVMSNVGATVLLVPLAVNIAVKVGADPALFALIVALSTSNSFFLPTHQVNALLMGPGGYRVADYMRAGGVMSVLFLVVMLTMLNLVF